MYSKGEIMKVYILKFLFFILIVICFVGNHELTHGQIASYFGCENISYGLSFKGAYTRSYCENDSEIMELAHSINEIVGYTIVPFMLIIIMILTFKE